MKAAQLAGAADRVHLLVSQKLTYCEFRAHATQLQQPPMGRVGARHNKRAAFSGEGAALILTRDVGMLETSQFPISIYCGG